MTLKVAGKNLFVGILGINGVPTLISSDGNNDLVIQLNSSIKELCIFDFSSPNTRLYYWNTLNNGNLSIKNNSTSETIFINHPDKLIDNRLNPNICLTDMTFKADISCVTLAYTCNLTNHYVYNPSVLTINNPVVANQTYWNAARTGVQKRIVIFY